ncbi:phage/plasmid primase, P4 family [Kyrpidia spormannii]|nr:phage/plasmid primase, P4 family [Kyrpidia spormannii]
MTPMVEYVIQYANRGWHVFPVYGIDDSGRCTCGREECSSAGKHPITKHGVKDATTDIDTIRQWWERWPDANVGLATGETSGIVVIDIDPDKGGNESFEDLVSRYGTLPDTVEAITGSGGRHIYFAYPIGVDIRSKIGVLPGIDVRANGGYAVAPPSRHKSGRRYEWELSAHPDETPIAPMPQWLIDVITNGQKRQAAPVSLVKRIDEPIPEGQRNDYLFRLASSLRSQGLEFEDILEALRDENKRRCDPPLDDSELMTIAKSACRYPAGTVRVLEPALRYFDGKTFIPARLAQDILDVQPFINFNGRLYAYKDGVYRPDGEDVAQRLALDYLGERYRAHYLDEITRYIKIRSKVNPDDVNRLDNYINVKNGLLDWTTGELHPHTPERLSTIQIPVEFDPNAKGERIREFFQAVLPADAIPFIEEWFGYMLLPTVKFKKALIFTGKGNNGKSVMIRLMEHFVGQSNCSHVSLHALETNRFQLAELDGKLLNSFADLPSKVVPSSNLFKCITGDDQVQVERKFGDPFTLKPTSKLVFSANTIPTNLESDDAYHDRWIVVRFPNQFPAGKADPNLTQKLTTPEELSGLLNMALEGLKRLMTNGRFTIGESMQEALDEFKRSSDNVSAFLYDMCVIEPTETVGKDLLYSTYAEWCADSNLKPLGKIRFNKRLQDLIPGLYEKRIKSNSRSWVGVGLAKDQDDDPTAVF